METLEETLKEENIGCVMLSVTGYLQCYRIFEFLYTCSKMNQSTLMSALLEYLS